MQIIGVFPKILFWQANVAILPNLSNWPLPMKERINLVGLLLGDVCQHDLFQFKWTTYLIEYK